MKSDYEKAVTFVKSAKKLEKKGKMDKAKDKYEKDHNLGLKITLSISTAILVLYFIYAAMELCFCAFLKNR